MGIAKSAWSSAVTSGSMDLYDGNQWAHKLVVKYIKTYTIIFRAFNKSGPE